MIGYILSSITLNSIEYIRGKKGPSTVDIEESTQFVIDEDTDSENDGADGATGSITEIELGKVERV